MISYHVPGYHGNSIVSDIHCSTMNLALRLFLPSPPAPSSLQHAPLPWPHQAMVHVHPLHHPSHQTTEHQPFPLRRRETGGRAHRRAAQTLYHIRHEVLCPRQVLCQNVMIQLLVFISVKYCKLTNTHSQWSGNCSISCSWRKWYIGCERFQHTLKKPWLSIH